MSQMIEEEVITVREKVKKVEGSVSNVYNGDRYDFKRRTFEKSLRSFSEGRLNDAEISKISSTLFHGKSYKIEIVDMKSIINQAKIGARTQKVTNEFAQKVLKTENTSVLLNSEEVLSIIDGSSDNLQLTKASAVYKRSTEIGSSNGVNNHRDTILVYVPGITNFKKTGNGFKL